MTVTNTRTKNFFPLLPFVASSIKLFLFITSYLSGIFYNKTLHYLPHPSELTVSEPECGIFGMALTLGSMLTFCVCILRYVQINNVYPRKYRKLNIFSLSIGVLMVTATMVSVVYPVDGEWSEVHLPVTCVFYVSAAFYMTTQTHISKNTEPFYNKCVCGVRITCSTLSMCTPIVYTLSRLLIATDKRWYGIPAACEWFMHLLLIVFIYTFCADFNKVKIRSYIYDENVSQTGSFRNGTNYVDCLRSQARARRKMSEGQSHIKYHINSIFFAELNFAG